jgi:hypothetical protein
MVGIEVLLSFAIDYMAAGARRGESFNCYCTKRPPGEPLRAAQGTMTKIL